MSGHIKPIALDVAFNNAGTEGVMGKPTAEQNWEDYREMFGVNVIGVPIKRRALLATAAVSALCHRHRPQDRDGTGRLRLLGRPEPTTTLATIASLNVPGNGQLTD